MRKSILFVLLVIPNLILAQTERPELKIIPEFAVKYGSQDPAIGIETDFVAGITYKNRFFLGMGGGYASDMGLGGHTFPFFLDGRMYFSPNKLLTRLGFNIQKQVNMQITVRDGITINPDDTYNTGFLFSAGMGFRFDPFKINSKSILPFYSGLRVEYNGTRFYDEYRGYEIAEGYISQLILQLYISFDFNTIKL